MRYEPKVSGGINPSENQKEKMMKTYKVLGAVRLFAVAELAVQAKNEEEARGKAKELSGEDEAWKLPAVLQSAVDSGIVESYEVFEVLE
jgi:hypothetical protein